MYCIYCGKLLSEGSSFCISCGKAVLKKNDVTPSVDGYQYGEARGIIDNVAAKKTSHNPFASLIGNSADTAGKSVIQRLSLGWQIVLVLLALIFIVTAIMVIINRLPKTDSKSISGTTIHMMDFLDSQSKILDTFYSITSEGLEAYISRNNLSIFTSLEQLEKEIINSTDIALSLFLATDPNEKELSDMYGELYATCEVQHAIVLEMTRELEENNYVEFSKWAKEFTREMESSLNSIKKIGAYNTKNNE